HLGQPDEARQRNDHGDRGEGADHAQDRKSTRLNSSHVSISYAVFCLKKKKLRKIQTSALITHYSEPLGKKVATSTVIAHTAAQNTYDSLSWCPRVPRFQPTPSPPSPPQGWHIFILFLH